MEVEPQESTSWNGLPEAGVFKGAEREVVLGTPGDDFIMAAGREYDFFGRPGGYTGLINGDIHYVDNPEDLVIAGVGGNDVILGGPEDDLIITGSGYNYIVDTRGNNRHFGGNEHHPSNVLTDGPSDFIAAPFNELQAEVMEEADIDRAQVATPNTTPYQEMITSMEVVDAIGETGTAAGGFRLLETQNVASYLSDDEGFGYAHLGGTIFVKFGKGVTAYAHETQHAVGDLAGPVEMSESGEPRAYAVGDLSGWFAEDHDLTVEEMKAETLTILNTPLYDHEFARLANQRLEWAVDFAFEKSIARMTPDLRSQLVRER